jgi:Protein of unknown function (DUF4043)
MAVTTIDTNNKLIRFTQDINREFVRGNQFSPYMSEGLDAVIRIRNELKAGGEDMNIPIVTRLTGAGVATTTLVGNEERIENYGMRLRMEWARHAVVTTKAESHKDSADIFGEAKPLLSDWGRELQRDELIAALMALPTETLPASSGGVRVNGIQYDLATAAQRNTWQTDNADRILYGNSTANLQAGNHATSLATLDTTNDKFTATNLSLMKRIALNADPHIRPYRTDDGYEYYIACCGTNPFRDLKISLETINKDARPREQGGPYGATQNPIFQDGDQIYDGVIVRQIPEISRFVTNVWTNLLTAGTASARVEPVFLLGQQAAVFGWGQMVRPTFRKEDDYGFITGVGIEMAYGVAKMFKKHPTTSSTLKQWGVVTGFFASASD